MANQIVNAAQGERVDHYLHIDDFSPGVFDNTYISTAEAIVSAPLGAANAEATYCCAAIPSGGLGPLPALTASEAYPYGLPGAATEAWITGFIVNPGLDSVNDELIIVWEADDGTTHYNYAYSDVPAISSVNFILENAAATQPGIFGAPYPVWTRMSVYFTDNASTTTAGSNIVTTTNDYVSEGVVKGSVISGIGIQAGATVLAVSSGSLTMSLPALISGTFTLTFTSSQNPPPVLVFPGALQHDGAGNFGHLYVYPPLLAPTSFAVQDLIVAHSSETGQTIAYGNRILVLAGVDYPWPAGGGINTNENINFTDPPQSSFYGDQMTILGTEIPWGYGAWGSVSVGELLLVKKEGGALMMYGDIFNPSSVVQIPGVQSTGDFVGQANASQTGLVYCAENLGAWLWNGGNTSQKISPQLRDDFYDVVTGSGLASNNYGFNVQNWQDWLLFSNNYLFNPQTNSWWVLYPTTANGNDTVPGHTLWWYSSSRFTNQMYAAPINFGTAPGLNMNWWYKFDNTIPAPHYQWQSLPVSLAPNSTRVVDVTQVVLRVSDPSDSGTATCSITISHAQGASETVTTPAGAIRQVPTSFRFNFGSGTLGINNPVITINGDNATLDASSPIVHSVDVGYKTRALKGTSN